MSILLAAGVSSPASAEEDEDAQIASSTMLQYEAWSERVETDALNMSEEEILRQAGDTREYVETTVTLGGQVASRSAESSEEENARFVKCTARIDYPHYSNGARGAIYKTRYKCESKGVSTKISLRVRGLLSLYPALPVQARGRERLRQGLGAMRELHSRPILGGSPIHTTPRSWDRTAAEERASGTAQARGSSPATHPSRASEQLRNLRRSGKGYETAILA